MRLVSTLWYVGYIYLFKFFSNHMAPLLDNQVAIYHTGTTKPVLCWMNLMAEKTALVNPSKLSNRAFLALNHQSSSPELRIQHAEHGDDHLNLTRTFSSLHMSPSSIGDHWHHDRPTSPSSGVILPSHTTSVAQTQTKKVAKSVAKFQQGVIIGKCPKAADNKEAHLLPFWYNLFWTTGQEAWLTNLWPCRFLRLAPTHCYLWLCSQDNHSSGGSELSALW